jgi:hypothetical protein
MPANYLNWNFVDSIKIGDRQMKKAQNEEEWISDVKKWMLSGTQVNNANAKKYFIYNWANTFFSKDNLLWVRIPYRGEPSRDFTVLPSTEMNKVIKDGQSTFFSAHEGVAKTRFRVTQNYLWPFMDRDIGEFIKSENVKKPEQTHNLSHIC